MHAVDAISVITLPTTPVPSVAEVKDHLGVDFTDDDADLLSKVWGAITEFEDPNLGYLGRSIIPRRLELRLNLFAEPINLPRGPVLQSEAYTFVIVYDDEAGAEQTLADSVYRILDAGRSDARVVLKPDQSWPNTSGEEHCVRVKYWAGYAADDVRINNFKSAVKLHVEMTYDGNTEDRYKIKETINRLLQPYRVYT